MTEKWLQLAKFDECCKYFDDVRSAEYFRVRTPDGSAFIGTRAWLESLRHRADADAIVFLPVTSDA
jgi:hypothetical protein